MRTMAKLKDGAWRVFNKIGCNTEVNRALLGEDGVTDHNVMQYLGVIEQRTNEILQMFAASRTARAAGSGADAQGPEGDGAFAALLPRGADVGGGARLRAAHRPAEHDRADGGGRLRGGGRRAAGRDEIRLKMPARCAGAKPARARPRRGGGGYRGEGFFSGTARAGRGTATESRPDARFGKGEGKHRVSEFRRVYCAIVTHTYDRVTGHRT